MTYIIMRYAVLVLVFLVTGLGLIVYGGYTGYVIGNVNETTIQSLVSHGVTVHKTCSCACRYVNESVVVVNNGVPVLIVESGAVYNGTIPPKHDGKIPVLHSNGTVSYTDASQIFMKCVRYQCAAPNREVGAALLGAGTVVLLATAYVYNRR